MSPARLSRVVGLTHRGAGYRVSREKLVEFATAIGETSPACTDVECAIRLGYPDLVAPPTFVATLALRAERALLTDPRLGLDLDRALHRGLRVACQRPLFAGDPVDCLVRIEAYDRVGTFLVLTTRCDVNVASTIVAEVWSTIVAPAR